jgi:hypothetical protein
VQRRRSNQAIQGFIQEEFDEADVETALTGKEKT